MKTEWNEKQMPAENNSWNLCILEYEQKKKPLNITQTDKPIHMHWDCLRLMFTGLDRFMVLANETNKNEKGEKKKTEKTLT